MESIDKVNLWLNDEDDDDGKKNDGREGVKSNNSGGGKKVPTPPPDRENSDGPPPMRKATPPPPSTTVTLAQLHHTLDKNEKDNKEGESSNQPPQKKLVRRDSKTVTTAVAVGSKGAEESAKKGSSQKIAGGPQQRRPGEGHQRTGSNASSGGGGSRKSTPVSSSQPPAPQNNNDMTNTPRGQKLSSHKTGSHQPTTPPDAPLEEGKEEEAGGGKNPRRKGTQHQEGDGARAKRKSNSSFIPPPPVVKAVVSGGPLSISSSSPPQGSNASTSVQSQLSALKKASTRRKEEKEEEEEEEGKGKDEEIEQGGLKKGVANNSIPQLPSLVGLKNKGGGSQQQGGKEEQQGIGGSARKQQPSQNRNGVGKPTAAAIVAEKAEEQPEKNDDGVTVPSTHHLRRRIQLKQEQSAVVRKNKTPTREEGEGSNFDDDDDDTTNNNNVSMIQNSANFSAVVETLQSSKWEAQQKALQQVRDVIMLSKSSEDLDLMRRHIHGLVNGIISICENARSSVSKLAIDTIGCFCKKMAVTHHSERTELFTPHEATKQQLQQQHQPSSPLVIIDHFAEKISTTLVNKGGSTSSKFLYDTSLYALREMVESMSSSRAMSALLNLPVPKTEKSKLLWGETIAHCLAVSSVHSFAGRATNVSGSLVTVVDVLVHDASVDVRDSGRKVAGLLVMYCSETGQNLPSIIAKNLTSPIHIEKVMSICQTQMVTHSDVSRQGGDPLVSPQVTPMSSPAKGGGAPSKKEHSPALLATSEKNDSEGSSPSSAALLPPKGPSAVVGNKAPQQQGPSSTATNKGGGSTPRGDRQNDGHHSNNPLVAKTPRGTGCTPRYNPDNDAKRAMPKVRQSPQTNTAEQQQQPTPSSATNTPRRTTSQKGGWQPPMPPSTEKKATTSGGDEANPRRYIEHPHMNKLDEEVHLATFSGPTDPSQTNPLPRHAKSEPSVSPKNPSEVKPPSAPMPGGGKGNGSFSSMPAPVVTNFSFVSGSNPVGSPSLSTSGLVNNREPSTGSTSFHNPSTSQSPSLSGVRNNSFMSNTLAQELGQHGPFSQPIAYATEGGPHERAEAIMKIDQLCQEKITKMGENPLASSALFLESTTAFALSDVIALRCADTNPKVQQVALACVPNLIKVLTPECVDATSPKWISCITTACSSSYNQISSNATHCLKEVVKACSPHEGKSLIYNLSTTMVSVRNVCAKTVLIEVLVELLVDMRRPASSSHSVEPSSPNKISKNESRYLFDMSVKLLQDPRTDVIEATKGLVMALLKPTNIKQQKGGEGKGKALSSSSNNGNAAAQQSSTTTLAYLLEEKDMLDHEGLSTAQWTMVKELIEKK